MKRYGSDKSMEYSGHAFTRSGGIPAYAPDFRCGAPDFHRRAGTRYDGGTGNFYCDTARRGGGYARRGRFIYSRHGIAYQSDFKIVVGIGARHGRGTETRFFA